MERSDTDSFDKIILGIDPGTNIMGYGIIGVNGKSFVLISTGIVKLDKIEDHGLKLKTIFDRVTGIIDSFKPDELAIEAPFYGKNVQSMLKLGRAQGVAIAAALQRQLPIYEYMPRKIKQAITGNGNATKEQVAAMLQSILKFEEMPKHLDATDGLAAAVCHLFQFAPRTFGTTIAKNKAKTAGGWAKFISENPDKVK